MASDDFFLTGSMPATTQICCQIVRNWRHIPDDVSIDSALEQKLISPLLIELIMQIVLYLIMECFPNAPNLAWTRIQRYLNSKEIERIGDNARLNFIIKRSLSDLGIPREPGDVVAIRKSLVETSITEEEFKQIQTEALFLTI